MIPPFVFVFDIETIPDEELAIRVLGEESDSFENVLEKQRQKYGKRTIHQVFLPPAFHKIICISYLVRLTNPDNTVERHTEVFAPPMKEVEILKAFWKRIGRLRLKSQDYGNSLPPEERPIIPFLVTFNGKEFDIPVIVARSLKHRNAFLEAKDPDIARGLSMFFDDTDRWEREKPNYTNRYSRYSVDMIDITAGKRHSLKALCSLCNIPVKTKGSADEVSTYYQEKNFDKISEYCIEDVKATYLLYLNYLLLKGNITETEQIKQEIKAVSNLKIHF